MSRFSFAVGGPPPTNHDDDQLVYVVRDEARTLKRCQVPVTKTLSRVIDGQVVSVAPRWAVNALRQCTRHAEQRAVMTLLRRAKHDADIRDALRAAVVGRCAPAFALTQKAAS